MSDPTLPLEPSGAPGEDPFGKTVKRAPEPRGNPAPATVPPAFDPATAPTRVGAVGRPAAGSVFGRYQILREIGRGGMGIVFEAHDPQLGRRVALKVLSDGAFAAPEDRERFRRESQIGARLAHPNIVAVHDVGEAEGRPFFTMELVGGGSLADRMGARPLEIQEAVLVLREVLRAVAHAHAQGIVHRDLKPSNILCEGAAGGAGAPPLRDGSALPRILVSDFGLGKVLAQPGSDRLTVSGAILGTPAYMPPEQANGRVGEVGPASDVYSVGAVLYEAVTGRPPFVGETPYEIWSRAARDAPRDPRSLNPRLSRDLDTIILKAMDRDPRRRYRTAQEMLDDVERFRAGEAIAARRLPLHERALRKIRRDPRAALLFALALLAPLAAVSALFWQLSRAATRRDEATGRWIESQRVRALGHPLAEQRVQLEAALAADPAHEESLLDLALLDLEEARLGDALDRLARMEALPRTRTTRDLHLAFALVEVGRTDEARALLAALPPQSAQDLGGWCARGVLAWLTDPGLVPPQPGYRWPLPAWLLDAGHAAGTAGPARRVFGTPSWADLDLTVRVRGWYLPALLQLGEPLPLGDAGPARAALLTTERSHPQWPTVVVRSAWLDPAGSDPARAQALTAALAVADRPELHVLMAELVRGQGDAAGERAALERAAASAAQRTAAARDPRERAYWRAWRAAALVRMGGRAAEARTELEQGGWCDAAGRLWPHGLARDLGH